MNKLLNPARNEGEAFEDYKQRRKAVNTVVKFYLRGRRVTGYTPVKGREARRAAH